MNEFIVMIIKLNSVICCVGHSDKRIVSIFGYAGGIRELAITAANAAPLSNVCSAGIKFLNAAVFSIHHVEIVLIIHAYVGWVVKLAIAVAQTAPLGQECTCLIARRWRIICRCHLESISMLSSQC